MFKVGDKVKTRPGVGTLSREGCVGTLQSSGFDSFLVAVFVDSRGDVYCFPVNKDGRHTNCSAEPYVELVDALKERWDKVDPAIKQLLRKLQNTAAYEAVEEALKVIGFTDREDRLRMYKEFFPTVGEPISS